MIRDFLVRSSDVKMNECIKMPKSRPRQLYIGRRFASLCKLQRSRTTRGENGSNLNANIDDFPELSAWGRNGRSMLAF